MTLILSLSENLKIGKIFLKTLKILAHLVGVTASYVKVLFLVWLILW